MIIQHNIMALNSYNRLSGNNSLVSKNLEKLSSGYKINRAGDDAAGLAISEKMRAQITGLSRASQNAQDGISLVQTAEGNLTEVHSMLNRMVDLATQSSNGTYDGASGVDRTNLEKEMQALKDEINRISETAHFNGIKLLDGSMGGAGKVTTTKGEAAKPEVAATAATVTIDLNTVLGTGIATGAKFAVGSLEATGDTTTASDKAKSLEAIHTAVDGKEVTLDSVAYTAALDKTTGILTLTEKTPADAGTAPDKAEIVKAVKNGSTLTNVAQVTATDGAAKVAAVDATAATTVIDYAGKTGASLLGTSLEFGGTTYQFVEDANEVKAGNTAIVLDKTANPTAIADAIAVKITGTAAAAGKLTFTGTETGVDAKAPVVKQVGGLNLQIGDTADQRVTVSVGDMGVTALGLDAVSILDEKSANKSIDLIKNAINTVSGTRADLGAIQNRLEHTINNLSTTTENMTAAESRIRDTDMAKEMMAFTKNNVLAQAAQAMLAQANQQPQQVLQLLR